MELRLYDLCGADETLRFSPYCWRAKMALAHKGLPYDTVATHYTGIKGIGAGEAKAVPVLSDDGTLVPDSFEIARHLDRTYPDLPLLFDGEAEVAATRFIEAWTFATLHPLVMRMIVKDIHSILSDDDQRYFRESREARLGKPLEEVQTGIEPNRSAFEAALTPVRQTLARYDWLGGEAPRFADYVVFGTLMWLNVIAGLIPLAATDPVDAWFQRCLDLHGGFARGARKAA